VLDESLALARTAAALAELDVLAGWAVLAREWDYCRPELDESDVFEIAEGRHPVVEQMLKSERNGLAGMQSFVPNDAFLASDDAQIPFITGPNMAGKSTYIRQVALIALLAQIGCWVPAKRCRVGSSTASSPASVKRRPRARQFHVHGRDERDGNISTTRPTVL